MKKLKLLSVLLTFLFLFSCSEDDDSNFVDENETKILKVELDFIGDIEENYNDLNIIFQFQSENGMTPTDYVENESEGLFKYFRYSYSELPMNLTFETDDKVSIASLGISTSSDEIKDFDRNIYEVRFYADNELFHTYTVSIIAGMPTFNTSMSADYQDY